MLFVLINYGSSDLFQISQFVNDRKVAHFDAIRSHERAVFRCTLKVPFSTNRAIVFTCSKEKHPNRRGDSGLAKTGLGSAGFPYAGET